MPAQQPTLDGTLPAVADDYHSWVDQVRPAFVEAARTGRLFTSYEICKDNNLPEPPNSRADWGNLVLQLVRDGLIEHAACRPQQPADRREVSRSCVARHTGCPRREGRVMVSDRQRDWNERGPLSSSIRGQRPRRLSPQQIDEVRRALADGTRATDLAAQYGVSVWTIRRYRPT